MFFLNLTVGEFLGLLGALGGLITALYLLDRAKRKKVVSTLRFWTSAVTAEEKQTRKRMRDPWSLILQLVSLCLLLLAIAQLQWGSHDRSGRDHVLLLDTSAWSGEVNGKMTLLDQERTLAQAYVARLSARDRVMIVQADALLTPATSFTADRGQMRTALAAARPGFSALNISQAFSYAQQAQTWSGGQPGEIVYVGPGEVDSDEQSQAQVPNLRVLSVPARHDNAGIVQMTVKRSDKTPGEWTADVTVRNYAQQPRTVRLNLRFGESVFAPRMLALPPKQETVAEYVFDTDGAGQLLATLDPLDSLQADNRVSLALPRNGLLRVALYTARPDTWRPLMEANSRVAATFVSPDQYRSNPKVDLVLFDGMAPSQRPAIPSLWIQPPHAGSPLPVASQAEDVAITNWNAANPIAAGLRTREARLPSAEVFQTFDGDLSIASVAAGPVVVARPAASGHPQLAVIGFDPLAGDMKFQVVTPLLFSNLLRWLAPDAFQRTEFSAGRVGAATVTLDANERWDQLRIRTAVGAAVPFTVHAQTLQLFTDRPAIITVSSPSRDRTLSLTLPDVAEYEWHAPAVAATGLPSASKWRSNSITLWQTLAVLGAIGLLVEWLLFGRRRAARLKRRVNTLRRSAGAAETKERELVSQ